ncbi:MAG: hypothetical protein ACNA8W_09020 [Bradymonadaceae bacterium]
MARKDLSSEHMIELGAKWVDPGRDRPILEGHELLRSALVIIERGYYDLLNLTKRLGSKEEAVAELTRELTALDARHDRLVRGIYRILEAGEDIADDVEEAERCQKARQTLTPDGLSVTRRSYREQAGNARRIEIQLDGETRDWLTGVIVHNRPLMSVVEDWFATARQIGKKVAERAELQGESSPDAVTARDLRDARHRWIRGVNTLIAFLDEDDIDPDVRRRLLVNLYEAEAQAAASRVNTPTPELEPVSPEVPEPA